jgi:SAM-dependent methyltransferase
MRDRVRRGSGSRSGCEEGDYGSYWAPYYDEIFDVVDEATVDLLDGYAGDPPRALELAVGTGRVALPLAERGVTVTGIDVSEEMVSRLKAKPGGEAIEVVIGDMAEVPVDGVFPLVYLPFNTFFGLLTQERQVQCFQNVADHLEAGGRFVLEGFVPDMKRFDANETRLGVISIDSLQEHSYEVAVHLPAEQRITSQYVRRMADGSTVVLPVEIRYAWPSEINLMARLAGLELEERWGWYDRRPFTGASGQHVSVYRKPG